MKLNMLRKQIIILFNNKNNNNNKKTLNQWRWWAELIDFYYKKNKINIGKNIVRDSSLFHYHFLFLFFD